VHVNMYTYKIGTQVECESVDRQTSSCFRNEINMSVWI